MPSLDALAFCPLTPCKLTLLTTWLVVACAMAKKALAAWLSELTCTATWVTWSSLTVIVACLIKLLAADLSAVPVLSRVMSTV